MWITDETRALVDELAEPMGPAWKTLGPDLRRALVAERVLFRLLARQGETEPLERWRQTMREVSEYLAYNWP